MNSSDEIPEIVGTNATPDQFNIRTSTPPLQVTSYPAAGLQPNMGAKDRPNMVAGIMPSTYGEGTKDPSNTIKKSSTYGEDSAEQSNASSVPSTHGEDSDMLRQSGEVFSTHGDVPATPEGFQRVDTEVFMQKDMGFVYSTEDMIRRQEQMRLEMEFERKRMEDAVRLFMDQMKVTNQRLKESMELEMKIRIQMDEVQ